MLQLLVLKGWLMRPAAGMYARNSSVSCGKLAASSQRMCTCCCVLVLQGHKPHCCKVLASLSLHLSSSG
jgi:hypothetical protein